MTARFDAVLFDAGGVLVLPDPVATGGVLGPLGGAIDVGSLTRAHYAGMRALDQAAERQRSLALERHDWAVYRRAYAAAAGVGEGHLSEAATGLAALFSPYLWRFPLLRAVAVLWRLHQAGVPMGVVSNASGQIEGVLATQGVCQVGTGAGVPVSVVVDSHVVGVAKPDPAIFAFALSALDGVDPARVAYVGDSAFNDVPAAAGAGLTPLHLDPFDDHPDASHERIAGLDELLGFVG